MASPTNIGQESSSISATDALLRKKIVMKNVRRFGKADMDVFRFTDTFVKSPDYDALEQSLAKYQACRIHDVDEKAWLSKRVTELEAALREIRDDTSVENEWASEKARRALTVPETKAHQLPTEDEQHDVPPLL